ncbi:MAG: copper chaperone PCu(A)C [Pseudomonadota bacterium]|nr:copper chaperone PCu(A)C [Pseudomonadota bacterium]
MKSFFRNILPGAVGVLALTAASVWAHDYKLGNLEIHHPVARATAPGAKVAGGYMTVTNHGTEADRLLGGTAGFAGKVEIHEMRMDGETMVMRPVEGGLVIPPGATVELKPGGYHIMFMKVGEQLKPDERRAAKLIFEKAGEVDIEFAVESMDKMKDHADSHAD